MGHGYLFNTKHIKFNNSNIKHKIPFNYKTINKPSNNNIFSRVKFNKPRGINIRNIPFCLVSLSLSVSISFFLCPPKIRNIHQRSRLLMEDSAHVGPFTKLGLRLCESLDSYSKTILVPSSTFRSVLDLGRWWRNEVRIFTANIKEARAFAVFWSQTAKAIPDINKPCSISDNSSIMALIVRYALIS